MDKPKVTTMEIKVGLQCQKCYKKIKKVLCKFPEIRDQVYDEKKNTVTIKVVSCCPEKIKQKICCKGGDSIKCIKIIPPPPPPSPTPSPPPCRCCGCGCGCLPIGVCCMECCKGRLGGPCYHGYVLLGTPVYDCWCGCGCRSGYFHVENPSACSIM